MLYINNITIVILLIIVTICISYKNDKYIISRKIRKHLIIKNSNINGDEYQYIPPPLTLPSDYVFIKPDVGPEIWIGSIVALIPIIWATFEFTSRIRTQQECLVCKGSGLVYVTKQGTSLTRARKW
jgi:hypothetical protein